MNPVGRPPIYVDSAKVFIESNGKTRLHPGGVRRAIVNAIIEHGGSMTLKALDKHFGFDVRRRVLLLQKAGWLRIEVKK